MNLSKNSRVQNFVDNYFFDKSKIAIVETKNEKMKIIVDDNFQKNQYVDENDNA